MKKCVFCISTGRSGTNLLAELFKLCENVSVRHEGRPGFETALWNERNGGLSKADFVEQVKLPFIQELEGDAYIETSHIFGKGFFEPMVQFNVPFSVVFLSRDPRLVAKSFARIGSVPMRRRYPFRKRLFMSKKKYAYKCDLMTTRYFVYPDQEGVMQLQNWQGMTDYQLAYWYVLEMERRKSYYIDQCQELGISYVEIKLHELKDFNKFSAMCDAFGLQLTEDAKELHQTIVSRKVNPKKTWFSRSLGDDLDKQEQQVWDSLKASDEEKSKLKAQIQARYGD